jgi:hypothetical protein
MGARAARRRFRMMSINKCVIELFARARGSRSGLQVRTCDRVRSIQCRGKDWPLSWCAGMRHESRKLSKILWRTSRDEPIGPGHKGTRHRYGVGHRMAHSVAEPCCAPTVNPHDLNIRLFTPSHGIVSCLRHPAYSVQLHRTLKPPTFRFTTSLRDSENRRSNFGRAIRMRQPATWQ